MNLHISYDIYETSVYIPLPKAQGLIESSTRIGSRVKNLGRG